MKDKKIGKLPEIRLLNSQYNLNDIGTKTKKELIELILNEKDIRVPISVFFNSAGPLECLVKYLVENGLSIKEISTRLNRHVQTIWTTLRNAKQKKFIFNDHKITIPLYIFSKDGKSILESLVHYLNVNYNLKFSEIASLLSTDTRIVWTYHSRFSKKEYSKEVKK